MNRPQKPRPRTATTLAAGLLLALAGSASAQSTGPVADRWEARGDRLEGRADRIGQRRQGRRG